MQDRILMTINEVTDDSTGIWSVGELEFGIKHTCIEYLESKPENRKLLSDWLKMLSERCASGEHPFTTTN